jgi:hypothetical protein
VFLSIAGITLRYNLFLIILVGFNFPLTTQKADGFFAAWRERLQGSKAIVCALGRRQNTTEGLSSI